MTARFIWWAIVPLCVATAVAATDSKMSVPDAAAPALKAVPLPEKEWPKLLPGKMAQQPTHKNGWKVSDIDAAIAQCAVLLKGLEVVATRAEPFSENGECGAPAAVELISVGKNPQVSFSPPVTVRCEVVAALHQWIKNDLQPLAQRHLGGPLVRIETMSSYSCRNAYGRSKTRLSEHGVANAVDIRAFVSASGHGTDVIADWGPTQRDIAAQVAAARAAAQKAEAERALAAAKTANPQQRIAVPVPSAAPPALQTPVPGIAAATSATALGLRQSVPVELPRQTITVGPDRPPAPGVAIQMPSSRGESGGTGIGLSFPGISRLGGPKAPVAAKSAVIDRTEFLRGAHTSACRIFGTVLGPEANNAHKNHFHVDMAERRSGNFCE
jgi:hypothetical protein